MSSKKAAEEHRSPIGAIVVILVSMMAILVTLGLNVWGW